MARLLCRRKLELGESGVGLGRCCRRLSREGSLGEWAMCCARCRELAEQAVAWMGSPTRVPDGMRQRNLNFNIFSYILFLN